MCCRLFRPAQTIWAAVVPLLTELDKQWGNFVGVYADFVNEETKRKWKWSRQMDQETKFWKKILIFCWAALLTIIWEAVTPVSIVLGIVVPVIMQYVMYDRPILNPITVALLVILPCKFVPGAAWRWI